MKRRVVLIPCISSNSGHGTNCGPIMELVTSFSTDGKGNSTYRRGLWKKLRKRRGEILPAIHTALNTRRFNDPN